jgi:hypothetical protein
LPLADQVRGLSERIQADLVAAHDYLEHTEAVWRLVEELTGLGHTYEIQSPKSGTVISLADLAVRAEHYVAGYLAEAVFQHFVSLFEDFVFELLRLWLSAYPAGIPNKDKKPVDLATIIDAIDKDAILGFVIERELNALRYERPASWFRYLNDRVKLGCPTDEQIERLAEIKASRDILIHNRGIVNETYLQKAGARARYKLGQRLEIPEPYLRDAWLLIRDIVRDLEAAAMAKA